MGVLRTRLGGVRARRIFSAVLSIGLLFSLSQVVMAETVTGAGGTDAGTLTVTVTTGTNAGVVYSVDIAWTDMELTYRDESARVWIPASHKYTYEAGWVDLSESNLPTVTATNHSNAAVKVSIAAGANASGVTYRLGDAVDLTSADQGTALGNVSNADKGAITIDPRDSKPTATFQKDGNTHDFSDEFTVTVSAAG